MPVSFRLSLAAALCLLLSSLAFAGGQKEPSAEIEVYAQDFEQSSAGWIARGYREKVVPVSGVSHAGSTSLGVSARESSWQGPLVDMTNILRQGKNYRIKLWLYYTDGPAKQVFTLSLLKTVAGLGQQFQNLQNYEIPKGVWTEVVLNYQVPVDRAVSELGIYFETQAPKDVKPIDFWLDDMSVTRIPVVNVMKAELDIPNLSDVMKGSFPIGTALDADYLRPSNPRFPLIQKHFRLLVLGNDMKQDAIQPVEGRFVYKGGDTLVAYAAKNGCEVRGHTLLWHQQAPAWMFQDPEDPTKSASRELLLKRIETHIKTVVGHYRGKVQSWDVVNEVLNPQGEPRSAGDGSKYRAILGTDEYIEKAFIWAHEADPSARLVINDFNLESSLVKRQGMYRLVKSLKEKGVPVDGVGLQMHISIYQPSVSEVRETIDLLASLGVKVLITELDLSIYASEGEAKKPVTPEILVEQARRYKALFDLFDEEYRAGKLESVIIWGTDDENTWLNNHPVKGRTDHPLLFDKALKAKPAYWALVDPSRLPVVNQKASSWALPGALPSAGDWRWQCASEQKLFDRQGRLAGRFRSLWSDGALYIRVQPERDFVGASITAYADPSGRNTTPSAIVQGSVADGTVLALPVPGVGKLGSVAFDLCLQKGDAKAVWNDTQFRQADSSAFYGTLNLKEMPVLATATAGTATVDAEVEAVWKKAASLPIALKSQGQTGAEGTVRLLWDANTLYALFEVKDPVLNVANPNVWEQDSVELFLDQNNAKTPQYEGDDSQCRVSIDNRVSFNGGCDTGGFRSAARKTADGYIVEMAVPLYGAVADRVVGFDAQINDSGASGARSAVRNWSDASNAGYCDTSHYGLVRLSGGEK